MIEILLLLLWKFILLLTRRYILNLFIDIIMIMILFISSTMFVICIYIYMVDFMNNGNEFSCSKTY